MDYKDALVAALAKIEMHPETHQQSIWWCGSAGCLAGHAIDINENTAFKSLTGNEEYDYDFVIDIPTRRGYATPQEWFISQGMHEADARSLFSPTNSLEDLRAGVKAVLNDENVWDEIIAARRESVRSIVGGYAIQE